MIRPIRISLPTGEVRLADLDLPVRPFSAEMPVEIEIGFGKGRYLLGRAAVEPERGFVGIETALEYYRLTNRRALRQGIENLMTIYGEAEYLMASVLEKGRADAVHVYFPDPWPKVRHRRRRLFEPQSLDLLLAMLRPGGRLFFATDHAEYGERVVEILRGHPVLEVEVLAGPWSDGPRTNYEAKYEIEGRPIRRLIATLTRCTGADLVHPDGRRAMVTGWGG